MAHQLHMSVHQLRGAMGSEEYVRWTRWFARRAQRQELALAELKGGGAP